MESTADGVDVDTEVGIGVCSTTDWGVITTDENLGALGVDSITVVGTRWEG